MIKPSIEFFEPYRDNSSQNSFPSLQTNTVIQCHQLLELTEFLNQFSLLSEACVKNRDSSVFILS